jgi:hypothetical protein
MSIAEIASSKFPEFLQVGRVKKSNCIIFALRRWFKYGGYVVLRKSNFGWWPHMIWTKDFATFEEFAPRIHNANMAFPPLLFKGVAKTTSREDQLANGLKGREGSTVVMKRDTGKSRQHAARSR